MAGVEQDELLIDAVRSYPCIYDVRTGEFKVVLVKENAWKAIVDILQRTDEMILLMLYRYSMFSTHIMTVCLVEDVRQRWRALRDRFVREIREKKQPSGSATKAIPP